MTQAEVRKKQEAEIEALQYAVSRLLTYLERTVDTMGVVIDRVESLEQMVTQEQHSSFRTAHIRRLQ